MADYNGVIVEGSQYEPYRKSTPVGTMVNGAARLIDTVPEAPSGSESVSESVFRPSIQLKRGGSVKMFAAIDVGKSVTCLAYAPAAGSVALRIFTRAGTLVADVYSAGTEAWERLALALPSGWPRGIYIIAVVNHSVFDNDVDKRAYFDSVEVV